MLDGKTLVDLRTVLGVAQATRAFLRKHVTTHPALAMLPERLAPLLPLHATLTRALDESGVVTDEASEELLEVRRTVRHLRDKLTRPSSMLDDVGMGLQMMRKGKLGLLPGRGGDRAAVNRMAKAAEAITKAREGGR